MVFHYYVALVTAATVKYSATAEQDGSGSEQKDGLDNSLHRPGELKKYSQQE
jgi:hypothetical protein